jgi:hypothetical protein
VLLYHCDAIVGVAPWYRSAGSKKATKTHGPLVRHACRVVTQQSGTRNVCEEVRVAAQCLVGRVKIIWLRFSVFPYNGRARSGSVGWDTALQAGRLRVRFIDYGTGVDSATNRNEYQEYFLEDLTGYLVYDRDLQDIWRMTWLTGHLEYDLTYRTSSVWRWLTGHLMCDGDLQDI